MPNSWVTIAEGGGGLTKRFKAIQMLPRIEVPKNIQRTINGARDIQYGGVLEEFRYVFYVPVTVSDTAYGTYDNLKTMAKRNNPQGTITPFFTFTDHYGVTHNSACFGDSEFMLEPLSIILDGAAAKYTVPVTILLYYGDTGV